MGQRSKQFWRLVNVLSSEAPAARSAPAVPPKRAFRFTADQRQAVVAAYEAGATMSSLAQQYGVKRDTIGKLLRREGVSIRRPRRITAAQVDEAVRLYVAGWSAARIADHLKFDQATIHNQLKKRGVSLRGPHDWRYL
ncbi:hypothetical protein P5P86_18165 [Nocardioides sp. BP30]|uniref:terminase gpP N-terminus-related DNA-binding protein n=1 Tax=Nocardioides sp. BP30 TaxID=3036374 RepID=UPI002469240F|nr:hypothetical protein [Nocardioides sp. BP30]WGL54235.1 hypothetical protein P5P86_18165 [Nocardioides sp. BP30]